jgi:hypothetical protein
MSGPAIFLTTGREMKSLGGVPRSALKRPGSRLAIDLMGSLWNMSNRDMLMHYTDYSSEDGKYV